jgi:hypothetical protein
MCEKASYYGVLAGLGVGSPTIITFLVGEGFGVCFGVGVLTGVAAGRSVRSTSGVDCGGTGVDRSGTSVAVGTAVSCAGVAAGSS